MQRRVTPRTKAVIICTPHNPASTIVLRPRLERLIASLGGDPPLVILDEAYRDFCDDPETADGVDLVRRHPTVIALRTFSKIAGLAGLRIGYAIAQARGHRAAQPGARAVQRQPPRPGRRRGRPGGHGASRAHARRDPRRAPPACALRWRRAALPPRPPRPISSWSGSATAPSALRAGAPRGGHPGARRRRRGLPRPPPHRDRHARAERPPPRPPGTRPTKQ